MAEILDLYENIKKTEIELNVNKAEMFNYVSKTSIHSIVTEWAYGLPLERSCVDISDGRVLSGKAKITDLNRRYFFKVIACMPNWQKYVNSFTVKVNDKTVYDKEDAFFEQVNLGWPALYIELDKTALKIGENEFSVSTTNVSGGGLYVSELSLVSYPIAENLSQVSVRKFIKQGEVFGVAVKDVKREFKCVKDVINCVFIKQSYYKDICVLTFSGQNIGKSCANVFFGDKTVRLSMPKIVENQDFFLSGTDSDDHRHDDSDETAFIIENVIFSDMGNFIQFRPHIYRNFYKLADKEKFAELIALMDAFGIKYGLADSDGAMPFLPYINPKMFFGYHIHEPYLFFNPALLDNPYEKDWFLCDPDRINASQSFGESKNLYMEILAASKKTFAKDLGITSFGSPSLLCVYEGDAGVDRLTIEPVSNMNLLLGAVRATSVKMWGAHLPTDWYFGVPVDKVKSNKYRLAMQ
ncbi:MAG: hypothetical protein J6Y43_00625, partial [Clostridia bacterium]|nr:hypothetical protein [Clostridia bacterium]